MNDLNVSAAHLADACRQLGVPVRCGPVGLRAATGAVRFAGPAQPVEHHGSNHIILHGIDVMTPGAVLVVDDGARLDRACIGDLMALEARQAGAAAIVINGLHRDTEELIEIDLPVFSLGSSPSGPVDTAPSPSDALERCHLGAWEITRNDYLVGDRDGVIIVPIDRLDEITAVAQSIGARERHQAAQAHAGVALRAQLDLAGYLAALADEPGLAFRAYLAARHAVET